MARSMFEFSPETTKFKRCLKSSLTASDDDKDSGYDLSIVPNESELKRVTPLFVDIQECKKKFKEIHKVYRVNSQDNTPLGDYLKLSGKDKISQLTEAEKQIEKLDKAYSQLRTICTTGTNKRSIIYGFFLYLSEKAVKKICDTVFGKGNDSSMRLLKLFKFDLKERRVGVLGRREYVESAMNMNNITELDRDKMTYNEGGNSIHR